MKVKAYLRIAHGKAKNGRRATTKLAIGHKPSAASLHRGERYSGVEPLPTVAFAVEFDVPDQLFARAEEVIATLSVPERSATIAAEVKDA